VLTLKCPSCCAEPRATICCGGDAELFDGVQGYRAALSRLLVWADGHYRHGLVDGTVQCDRCGRSIRLRKYRYEDLPLPLKGMHAARAECRACNWSIDAALAGIVGCLPAARVFWRDHPRMVILPEREVEAAGRRAFVTSLQDATGRATLDVVSACDTFEVLGIHGGQCEQHGAHHGGHRRAGVDQAL
jgi:hypothetical protein